MNNLNDQELFRRLLAKFGSHSAAARALGLRPRAYRANRQCGQFKRRSVRRLAIEILKGR